MRHAHYGERDVSDLVDKQLDRSLNLIVTWRFEKVNTDRPLVQATRSSPRHFLPYPRPPGLNPRIWEGAALDRLLQRLRRVLAKGTQ